MTTATYKRINQDFEYLGELYEVDVEVEILVDIAKEMGFFNPHASSVEVIIVGGTIQSYTTHDVIDVLNLPDPFFSDLVVEMERRVA